MNASDHPRYQILVVDDEPTVCRAIKMLLQFDGHFVQTVDSGEAALALLEQCPFDLIITDFSLSPHGLNGVQLAAGIKERQPDLPVILATAFYADANHWHPPVAVVDSILNKPFSQKELREAIVRVMSLKKFPSQPAAPLVPPPPKDQSDSSSERPKG
jgi:CheY-like chemotaxis protein